MDPWPDMHGILMIKQLHRVLSICSVACCARGAANIRRGIVLCQWDIKISRGRGKALCDADEGIGIRYSLDKTKGHVWRCGDQLFKEAEFS